MRTLPVLTLAIVACGGTPDDTDPGPTNPGTVTGPACDPQAVVTPEHPVEGDTVMWAFTCATGEAIGSYELSLSSGPAGASITADGAGLQFPTGDGDSGRHEVFVQFSGAGSIPEVFTDGQWVADDPGSATGPDPASYTKEFGLPVLHIDSDAALDDVGVGATLWWDGDSQVGTAGWLPGSVDDNGKRDLVVTTGATPIDWNAGGVDDRSTLVLWSSNGDPSYTRRRLAHELWEELRESGTASGVPNRAFWTVVYLDGAYAGLFVAAGLPDTDLAVEADLSETSETWMGLDADANFRRLDAQGLPKLTLSQGLERTAGTSDVAIEDLVAFASDSSAEDYWTQLATHINVEELVDYLVFAHHIGAEDSLASGVGFVFDPVGEQMHPTPWDLSTAFGLTRTGGSQDPAVHPDAGAANQLFSQLLASTGGGTVGNTWTVLTATGQPLSADAMHLRLDEWWLDITVSAERDRTVFGGSAQDVTDGQAALRAWIDDRAAASVAP